MKKWFKENKKLLIISGISIIGIIVILTIILIININKESRLDKFNNTIIAVIEKAKINIKNSNDKYILIEFPDKQNIISNKGIITNLQNKKYEEFTKGYFIIYNDSTYAFKLTNGVYCGTKDYLEKEISVDISGECENYNIKYDED